MADFFRALFAVDGPLTGYTAEIGGPITHLIADTDGGASAGFWTDDPSTDLVQSAYSITAGALIPAYTPSTGTNRQSSFVPTATPPSADGFIEVGVRGLPRGANNTFAFNILCAFRGSLLSPSDPDWPSSVAGMPALGMSFDLVDWGDAAAFAGVRRHYYRPDQSHVRTLIDSYSEGTDFDVGIVLANDVDYDMLLRVELSGFTFSAYVNNQLLVTDTAASDFPAGAGFWSVWATYISRTSCPIPRITRMRMGPLPWTAYPHVPSPAFWTDFTLSAETDS